MDIETLRGRRATDRFNRISIGDLLERPSWAMPDRVAIIATPAANETDTARSFTYREADRLANQVANGLIAEGLEAGDICLLICDNSAEALITKLGMAKAGVVAAPINPALDTAVVEQIIAKISPVAAIMDAEHQQKFWALFSEQEVRPLFSIDTTSVEKTSDDIQCFSAFVNNHPSSEPTVEIHGDDIWQLLFTSGSTSTPKAVMTSHINSYMSAAAWLTTLARGLRVPEDTSVGVGLPIIYHVGDALVYGTFLNAGTVVLDRHPTPESLAEMISAFEVTTFWGGMPSVIRSTLEVFDARNDLTASSLQTIMTGWAPLDEELFERYQALIGREVFFCQLLGQTEVVVAHRFWPNEQRRLFHENPSINYVGQPHSLLAARIEHQGNNAEVTSGERRTGEVVYRSPALSPGYYRDVEASKNSYRDDWFHSGDSFAEGEENQRIMVDRIKDIIKSGGENVISAFVESILASHPKVAAAAVVGTPHERWGEAVTAVVVLTETGITENELVAYCKERLANFEVPKRIHFVDRLPTTVGGKLQKHRVRKFVREIAQTH